MARNPKEPADARRFLADAERLENRARVASPGHATMLRQQAQNLRAAAARMADRHRQQHNDDLFN